MEKPDEGKRIRMRYWDDNIYVCPFTDSDGQLIAIDLSQSTGDDNHLTQAGLRFVLELIVSLLKHDGGLADVADAAYVSSLSSSDLPGIIKEIISEFL